MKSTKETIAELCKAMKLSARLAENAMSVTGKTNQEYLINLLQSEVDQRRNATITKRMNEAKFPYTESFDEFIADEVIFPDDFTVQDCKDLTFLDQKKNILLFGNPGTGKTMLSICIGIQACLSGISVRYFRIEDLIARLKEAHKEGRLAALKEKYSSARIIILDEFGYIPYDLEGAQLLFNFVSEYYQKTSIIMTTNQEFSEWRETLVDPKLTKAFVGRIIHHCEIVVFPGEDRRIKNSNLSKMYRLLIKENDKENSTDEVYGRKSEKNSGKGLY